MTRSKVKLELIKNDSSRKQTFKKRKKGILKKIDELTTLCGIDGCLIISSPYDDQPEVWPDPTGAQPVLDRFDNLPQEEQEKKMLDQESYLQMRVDKAALLLEKLRKDSRERELTKLMFSVLDGTRDLEQLGAEEVEALWGLAKKTSAYVFGSLGGGN